MKKIVRRSRRVMAMVGLSWRCVRLTLRGQKSLLPQTVYTGFRDLGGVYVKFLQLLVLRSETFQTLKQYDIYDVYDQVNVEPIDIRKVLRKELGGRVSEVVLRSQEPFAAGSFGQVYLADYQGQQVILKVLRPTVVSDLQFDLRVLGFFSWCLDWFSAGSPVNGRQAHKEFAKVTTLETNYILEADYASTLHERYKNHSNIVIPRTYRELSTKRLICQDYLDGLAVTDLIKAVKAGANSEQYVSQVMGSDLQQQMVALGAEMLSSSFLYGTSYGDPHPGNVKLLSGNRVGLIDFGLQAPAPRDTATFRRLIEQYHKTYCGKSDLKGYSQVLLEMYGGDVVRALYSLDEYYAAGSHQLMDTIISNAEQIMLKSDQTRTLLQDNKVALMFNSVVNKNNRFCLKYELDGPELIRAGILFAAIGESLGIGMKQSIMRQTYEQVLERTKDVALSGGRPVLHPETALEILASWFDQIAQANPQLYRQIKQERLSYV